MENQEKNNQDVINTPIQNMVADTQKDSTVGPMIGSIVIILIVIIGGLYFWGSLITEKKSEIQTEDALQEQSETLEVEQTAKQSASDDTSSIEADLEATNVDSLDSGIEDIDSEF
jgi:uncharacterized protein HemX